MIDIKSKNILLYSYFRSSCSYRVRIGLNLKKINYEYIPVHLVKDGGEQNKELFFQLNPRREVPFFIDKDVQLSQSMAILMYIDEAYEGVKLFGENSIERSKIVELCEMINSGIQPIQNLKVLNYINSIYRADQKAKEQWVKYWIDEGFEALEQKLVKTSGKFSYGELVSAADLFLIPQVYNAQRFNVEIDKFKTIKRINERCMQLDAFKKAAPKVQPDAPGPLEGD